jgi:alkanesulfonate monooxygenase SsuD/methylene tetrahydromethanopterin reductase-like flavin-dependent oxidoreductase (luciferase family)
MKGKAALLAGLSIGYVLGTRAGRERYEQIKAQATRAWHDPRVQETTDKAQAKAQEAVKQAAGAAQDKLRNGSSDGGPSTKVPSPTSPAPSTQGTA